MGMSESFSRLCHSYLNLADRFQQLDVECMDLKARLVPVLHNLKAKDNEIERLTEANQRLTAELETITAKYDVLKPFEQVKTGELQALLEQAEEQADLVDETLREMDSDSMPGLAPQDKAVLEQFYTHPEQFIAGAKSHSQNGNDQQTESLPLVTALESDSASVAEPV